MIKERFHDCPNCRCGQIRLGWSDREVYVFSEDLDSFAAVILNCALDHAYERGKGVPYGLDWDLECKLQHVVTKHLSAKDSDWLNNTVDLDDTERESFLYDIISVLKRAG